VGGAGLRGIVAIVALVGCEPLGGVEQVLLIAQGDDGSYGLHVREVEADDFHALRGEAVEFLARPTMVVGANGVATIEGGVSLEVEYSREGGHLVALDHDGLVAVSAYHHLTRANAYFAGLGFRSELGPLAGLVQPLADYGGGVGPFEFHDNASYVPSVRAFLLLEEEWLDYVPLAANEGVMTHEHAHAVFDEIAGGPEPGWDRPSQNLWRSINEGLADVHAVALTGNPAYGKASAGRFVAGRDVSTDALSLSLTDELLATALEDTYNPYPIGTVFAAVFWDYRAALVELGRDPAEASRQMGALALRGLMSLERRPDGFGLSELAVVVAEQAVAGPEREAICAALGVRVDPVMSEVSACP
jgi:hypothetical protein